jgi:peroxiredoxin/uncharacterized membrane protein YphA (DoxX/SURF4 family)
METALLIARLLLALVFAVAGVAKLADLPGARRAVADFGVPSALATSLGLLLPLAELTLAALLIPTSTAWWGALGALGLLLLFVAGIAINLARGRRPDCHCFGQLHSAPAGYSTLMRNGVLAAVAGFVLWQGREYAGPSVFAWLGSLPAAQLLGLIAGLVLLALLAGQWWFLSRLLSQNGRLLLRIEALEAGFASGGGALPSQNGAQPAPGLPVGSQAPGFSLKGLYGETLTLEALRSSEKPVMLIFTDPECGPCTALLPEIGRWQQGYADKLTIALISRGTAKKNRAKITEHGVKHVLLQKDWEVSEDYEASGTPSAVLVLADGTIGSQVVAGSEAIGSLLTQTVASIPENKIGEPAPSFKLPSLDGEDIELADFRGEKTLVLFWNPGCGFCQQMLPDLKEWEANPPKGAPKLLVVSTGTKEANEAMGLSSPVVLDQNFQVGPAFGANGTPIAVLVDEHGKVASEVAAGAPAVLQLVRAEVGAS